MAKVLITATHVREALAAGRKKLEVPKGAVITPLAAELAGSEGVEFVDVPQAAAPAKPKEVIAKSPHNPPANQVVALGSDHGGFQLKEMLKKFVEGLGYQVLDVGTHSEEACDYPDFAYAVGKAVASGEAWRGIMIDGAGIGSCIVANKIPGIKAACCHNEFVARNAREHNDTNVLTLGSRVIGSEVCKEIVKIWLETWFSGGRHKTRVDKIDDVERRFVQ